MAVQVQFCWIELQQL